MALHCIELLQISINIAAPLHKLEESKYPLTL